jgi:glycosyltransferase involved in cell wall biosynthesis
MNKVVLINQNTGYLTIDIANAFASNCKKVVLIAGVVKPMERELNLSIKIHKIIMLDRTSSLKRILTWGWGSVQIFLLLLLKYRHYKVIYFTNPPMAYLSSLFLCNKFSIIVYDTYPDALTNIGIKRNNLIYRIWSHANKNLFKKADKIITLSNGMADQLSLYVERKKIEVIPNWSGSDRLSPIKKEENSFIINHGLEDKFIILYSGNMGYTHNVETLIEVAKILENHKHIHFLFIGDGEKKEKLVKLTKQYHLNNCLFMNLQPANVFPYSLAAGDLSVITLNDDTAHLSVPSKTYNILAVGSPMLCIAPDNSEISLLVKKYNNGVCFEKHQVEEIATFILDLSINSTLHKELSDKSIKASEDFHYSNALNYL